jgi:flavin-dependent dehydrogenase
MSQSGESLPVVLGSSATGLLLSLQLSRDGIDHILIGTDEPPPAIPRLGESIIDTSSPELWRLYGHEFPECFHYKNHIAYLDGNFAALCHLASPLRSKTRVNKFARPDGGKTRYPWFGEGLFHLDRIAFDRAAYFKARAHPQCRFMAKWVKKLTLENDRVTRIELEGGDTIEKPKYVFDATGFAGLVARAAKVGMKPVSVPQRVVWTHYRRETLDEIPQEWWRQGTNLMRLDQEHDGLDGMSWMISLGKTLSVGLSVDAEGPHGDDTDEQLTEALAAAWRRRGIDFAKLYPDRQPIQQLRHSYFVRDRAYGRNWLLVGPTYITIWFPGSTGLWTVCAAAGMAKRLIEKPELGAFYQKSMYSLLHFHKLLDDVAHGPIWTSSFQVYRFFGKAGAFIWSRIADYLRIRDDDYGWFRPSAWFLNALEICGRRFPPFMVFFFVFALVRSRLDVDRTRQGRAWPMYFKSITFRLWNALRFVPHLLWASVPRRRLPARE